MKKSSRIILILAAVFTGLGVIFISVSLLSGVRPLDLFRQGYMDISLSSGGGSEYSAQGQYEISPAGIRDIELSWTGGRVSLALYDGDSIILEESSSGDIAQKNALSCRLNEDTLEINEYSSRVGIFFSRSFRQAKDLKILIPEAMVLDSFEVSAVSSHLSFEGLVAQELEIDIVSGDTELRNLKLHSLEFKSVDGALNIAASDLAELEAETVSGSLSAELTVCPGELDFETVSGNAELFLPQGSDFSLSMDRVSGRLESEFEGVYRDDDFISGSGAADFDFESISGNVKIYKSR